MGRKNPFLRAKRKLNNGELKIEIRKLELSLQNKEDEIKSQKEQIEALTKMTSNSVYSALIELGVDASNLSFSHNDILYKGKKFMGYEQLISNGVFTEDIVITLEYTPEKEIFQRLTGKYALTRGITGIVEETQCFTKQQLIDKLLTKFEAFAKTLT